MITTHTEMDGGLLVVTMSGEVQAKDYEQALVPAVEAALENNDKIRLLVIAGDDFEGYDMGAAWADTKLGMSHWRGFERVAVATNKGWMKNAIRLGSPLMPCPVQVFSSLQVEDARRWLRESLGTIHVIDLGGPCVQVKLMGEVDAASYEQAEGDLDAMIRARDGFRLLLDLTEFTGWQGISALSAHFSLAREHASLPDKVALVGDKAWQHLALRIGKLFLNAEARFFDGEDMEAAKTWLAA